MFKFKDYLLYAGLFVVFFLSPSAAKADCNKKLYKEVKIKCAGHPYSDKCKEDLYPALDTKGLIDSRMDLMDCVMTEFGEVMGSTGASVSLISSMTSETTLLSPESISKTKPYCLSDCTNWENKVKSWAEVERKSYLATGKAIGKNKKNHISLALICAPATNKYYADGLASFYDSLGTQSFFKEAKSKLFNEVANKAKCPLKDFEPSYQNTITNWLNK